MSHILAESSSVANDTKADNRPKMLYGSQNVYYQFLSWLVLQLK